MQKGGLLKKAKETSPEEVYEAEEHLKKLVDQLKDSEDIELAMTVYDDEDEKNFNLDNIHVTNETQGLEDIADQVAVENGNDEESMKLVWLLHDQLNQPDDDDDEDQEDDEEDIEDNDYEEDVNEPDPEADFADFGTDISSPTTDESMPDSMRESMGKTGNADAVTSEPFAPYSFEEKPDTTTKASVSIEDLALPTVISLGDYADSSLIDKAVAAYTGESLNINQQAKALGLTDDPKDKFDRELNVAIISAMAKNDLTSARGDFLSSLGSLKNSALDDLTDYYRQVNSQTLAEEAEAKAEDKLEDLKEEIQEENANLQGQSRAKQEAKRKQLEDETESLVEKYRAELEAKNRLTLEDFANQCQKELEDKKLENDEKYKQRLAEVKSEKQKDIANARNQNLEEYRRNQLAELTQAALTAFETANGKLSEGLKEISPIIENAVKKIDAEREAARKEADAAMARQKAMELRERQLAIDEFAAKEEQRVHDAELNLKRQELEYHNQLLTRSFERPFDAYSAPSRHDAYTSPSQRSDAQTAASRRPDAVTGSSQAGQAREAKQPASSTQADDSSSTGPEPDAQAGLRSQDEHDASKEKIEPESYNGDELTEKDKRHLKSACALAVFLALGAALGSAIWDVQQKSDDWTEPTAVFSSKTADIASAFSASITSKGSSKAMSTTQKKKEIAKLEASQAKLMKKYEKLEKSKKKAYGYAGYMKAKTKAGKMVQLDAMLGQQDVKSLRKINKSDPTATSRLYQALADGSDSQARVLWLAMPKKEQRSLSKLARNSVALSFYAVSDWQHGWQAKEGV